MYFYFEYVDFFFFFKIPAQNLKFQFHILFFQVQNFWPQLSAINSAIMITLIIWTNGLLWRWHAELVAFPLFFISPPLSFFVLAGAAVLVLPNYICATEVAPLFRTNSSTAMETTQLFLSLMLFVTKFIGATSWYQVTIEPQFSKSWDTQYRNDVKKLKNLTWFIHWLLPLQLQVKTLPHISNI